MEKLVISMINSRKEIYIDRDILLNGLEITLRNLKERGIATPERADLTKTESGQWCLHESAILG